MAASVFIDGASGTTGLEIRQRLEGRGDFTLIALADDRRRDPAARREALNEADFAILCLPDDAAREAVALLDENAATRVIDASSAHRTAPGWVYGFPELVGREAVANARRVANPGCYPTGFLGLVAPLVRAGLLPADWAYSVNAVSGYSGGGKGLIERFASETDIAFRTYGLQFGHKHLPEMRAHAGLTHDPLFAPSVVPAFRGMMVEVPLPLAAIRVSAAPADLFDALGEFYGAGPVVRAAAHRDAGEVLLRTHGAARDDMVLHVFGAHDGGQARLIARLDNLGKGASGAAVQSLNLMAGLPETRGLVLPESLPD